MSVTQIYTVEESTVESGEDETDAGGNCVIRGGGSGGGEDETVGGGSHGDEVDTSQKESLHLCVLWVYSLAIIFALEI